MDDKSMTPISKLAEVDPVFREVVSKLYPAADPRELWDISKMSDQSEVHVANGGLSARKKIAIGAGLGIGLGADLIGAKAVGRGAFKAAKATVPHIGEAKTIGAKFGAMKPLLKPSAESALVGVNTATGVATGAALLHHKKNSVSKAAFLEACQPIIKARREGVINTEKALELIEQVEKGLLFNETGDAHGLKTLNSALRMQRQFVTLPNAEKFRQRGNLAAEKGRKTVGAVAASAAAVGGHHREVKAQENKLKPPIMPPQSAVKKSESDYEFSGEISKFDEDKRQVFGWCSLSTVDGLPVVDLQDDYITIEEIEKAAFDYVKKSRKGGDMHARVGDEPVHTSDLIESVIITPDKLRKMGVPDEAISKVHTGWWVGFQVNDDEQWQKVKSGERTGFSIHGKGSRLEKVLD
jgi:hypothetical protein